MGLFSSLVSAFKAWQSSQQGQMFQKPAGWRIYYVPHTRDLMFPAPLIRFDEIAANEHNDPRAVVYTISGLLHEKRRPFSDEDLNALDFGKGKDGKKKAYQILLRKGLIQKPSLDELLAEVYNTKELRKFLRERNLPVDGDKPELITRLVESGFKGDRRKYRYRLFRLTENGVNLIKECQEDEKQAFFLAVNALKEGDYGGAIAAYRSFDSKWGFVHASWKNHTIFAHRDIPFSQFEFIARYPMRELQNSDDFKSTLRACLIAGLMGKSNYIKEALEALHEQIQCPSIIDLYRRGSFDDGVDMDMIAAMQRNVQSDNSYVLEYYISHIMYLSRC